MNIFITDKCPIKSAQNLDDKRVNKMILESAQMLCTALDEHGGLVTKGKDKFFISGNKAYKPTHKNHPSNIWCRETRENYNWLLRHFKALYDERKYRTGKGHKSFELYDDLVAGANYIPRGKLTDFPNCAARKDMGIDYKHMTDIPAAYQLYLLDRWATDKLTPKWTKRTRPY
jgi:hypothetical protein